MPDDDWIKTATTHMRIKYAVDLNEFFDAREVTNYQDAFADPIAFVEWFARKYDLDTKDFLLSPLQRR